VQHWIQEAESKSDFCNFATVHQTGSDRGSV